MSVTSEERIQALRRFGSKPGLERMRALMNSLGNPQRDLRVIHVAGTNGKGSVCRYIYEGLRANGCDAGLFTSPFMTDFRGAIIRNDCVMSNAALDEYAERVFRAIAEMREGGMESPTEFEVVTALALLFFSENPVDCAVLEVGLGGKGDSTNITDDCLMSVVTSVSLDHSDVLGDTVEAVAEEKAGIIKAGRPVVSGAAGAAGAVIKRFARQGGCEIFDAARVVPYDVGTDMTGTMFSANLDGEIFESVKLSMVGRFQAENAICALYAFRILRDACGFGLDERRWREGLLRATLPGRFERVLPRAFSRPAEPGRDPGNEAVVIMDGAHNPDGMRRIAETVEELFPGGRTLTVFSALRDKNVAEMLEICDGISRKMILTEQSNARGATAEELRRTLRGIRSARSEKDAAADLSFERDEAIADSSEAIVAALRERDAYDLILITGSLYFIRETREELLLEEFDRDRHQSK
ncbi:MAG: bifunctional folylpolyglutamate synthase/dihydrofolate synthase [Clostridiales Family XIII bacterium]|jgi:dihydrofolate synthase/folylpolyglutamate synthase|nr:bifunctional folylpolyglutamate synthase/dihydrofolate synthase [Clostridiales Family XIII bacterium]